MESLPPVSVVICARNEINNLKKNLPALLSQDYPEFEVIVVNDNSDDDSEHFLNKLSEQNPVLVVRHLLQASHSMKGKKYPLTIGIRAARFEQVLLTDADCHPASSSWIKSMASCFNGLKKIVLGYSPYKKHRGLLNYFIRYECFVSALQYLSFALARLPYLGVGRNLAYDKQLFFSHNIFPRYSSLLSGDDDLFINAAANSQNTAVCIQKDSFMFSEPKKTWEEYWFQKGRHVGTARHYKWHHQLLLLLFSISHFVFYVALLLILMYEKQPLMVAIAYSSRMLLQGVVYFFSMKKLGEEDLIWIFPFMDIFILLYYLKLLPDLFHRKTTAWK